MSVAIPARLLGLIAVALGLIKWIGPGDSDLPPWLLASVACSEVVAGACLLWRPVWWASGWMFVIATLGGGYALFHQRLLCGCLGEWITLSWRGHALFSATVAALAVWATYALFVARDSQNQPEPS